MPVGDGCTYLQTALPIDNPLSKLINLRKIIPISGFIFWWGKDRPYGWWILCWGCDIILDEVYLLKRSGFD